MGLLAPRSSAQTFFGSIVGTATDSTGAAVPNALVTITNLGTNEKRSAATDGSGDYHFLNLVPATYRVEVQQTGFKHFLRSPVVVEVDTAVRVDVALQLGAVTETVEVTTAPPMLQTETGSLGETIEAAQVKEMPLNGRNTFNLMTLVPSVVPQGNTSGAAQMNTGTSTSSGAWSNYEIGGGMPLQSAMYIDGGPINTVQRNYSVLVPVQDTIQEFKVETSAVSPEFGRYGGGIVNMTTKSGTNEFHGTVYEYLRNSVLNANYFFSNRSHAARPQWNQNQYGVAVGGPVLKNKLFLFGAWEAIHIRTGAPTLTNVPTPGMLQGVIPEVYSSSGTLINSHVYDPRGNCQVTHQPGTAAAPGTWTITNLWVGACGDPTAKVLSTFYPSQPNNAANATDNWYKTISQGDDSYQVTARVDYNLSSKQTIFGRFTFWPSADIAPSVVGNNNGWTTDGFSSHNHTYQVVLGDTYATNPPTVFDFRASFLRNYGDAIPPSFGTVDESKFGSAYAALAPYMSYQAYPFWSFSGGTQTHNLFNFAYNDESRQYYDSYNISGSVTKTLGKHTLKMGGEARELQRADPGADTAPSGSFTFSSDLGGDEWANFLMGAFDTGSITAVRATFLQTFYYGLYVNDTWQATPKLTLNLGLRYELPGGMDDRHDSATVLLPNTVDPITGIKGTLGLVNSSLYPYRTTLAPFHHAIGPRFGVAYRLSNTTVIRGGYSLSYLSNDQQPNALPYNSPVNSFTTTNSNSTTAINYLLSNPFPVTTQYPHGFAQAFGRSNPNFMASYIGQAIASPYPYAPYPHEQEMNISAGHQFRADLLVDLGLEHTLGTHLASISGGLDQLPDQYDALGSALSAKVSTPIVYDGVTLPSAYQTYGQTLRPYPAYTNFSNNSAFNANSSYNALELKVQKRFQAAGQIGAAYTWSKMIGNADTISANQETKSGVAGVTGEGAYQDYDNPKGERSIYSFNVPNRLVVNYLLNLPFGHGQHFAAGAHGVAGGFISGWAVDGITTFQSGFPLYFNVSSNNLSKYFGAGTIRPNYTAGCNKTIGGSGYSRALPGKTWFNTGCFTVPGPYSFGNEPRVDGTLKASGIDNWDASIQKSTPVHDQIAVVFRVEFFNLFNRVQFGDPVLQTDNSQFGQILYQYNKPRLIQGALRINF